MGIKIHWEDTDKTVMRQVYKGQWTVDDYRHIVETTRKLLLGLPHTVHIIMDLTTSDGTPSNILSAMRYAETKVMPNQGQVVIVGADAFTEDIIKIARRIAPRATGDGHLVETLEEARALIGYSPRIPV